jgi:hypothetical protein
MGEDGEIKIDVIFIDFEDCKWRQLRDKFQIRRLYSPTRVSKLTDTKNGRLRKAAISIQRAGLTKFLLATHDSRHTATFRLASSPMYQ